jgi:hypothetical protein
MRYALASLALAAVLPLSLLACDKDDAKGASGQPSASAPAAPSVSAPVAATSASAAPSAAASAAAPAPKCPPGLTGNPMPAYCIKVPASYSVKEPRISPTKGSIAYDTGTQTDNLMVSYDSTSIDAQAKDVESELKFGGDKLEKKGDLPGGGKWFQGSHQDFERVVTLVKGPAGLTLKCSFAYQPKNAPPKDAIDACKSIVIPPS